MLKLANDGLEAIKGDFHLASAMEVSSGKWIAHPLKGDHMVMFNYKSGILSLSMGESEHEMEYSFQIIAYDNTDMLFGVNKITFEDILTLLNWTCDDYLH